MASDYKRFKIPSRIPYERNTHPTPFSCASLTPEKLKLSTSVWQEGTTRTKYLTTTSTLPFENKRFYSYYLGRIICTYTVRIIRNGSTSHEPVVTARTWARADL